MRKIDDYLIDNVFQKIADHLASRITPGVLAQNFLILCSLIVIWRTWLYWLQGELGIRTIILGPMFICILLFWAFESGKRNKSNFAPIERLSLFWIRIFVVMSVIALVVLFLMLIIPGEGERLTILNYTGLIERMTEMCGLYFMACRTNPPKTKEFFAEKFAPATNR